MERKVKVKKRLDGLKQRYNRAERSHLAAGVQFIAAAGEEPDDVLAELIKKYPKWAKDIERREKEMAVVK